MIKMYIRDVDIDNDDSIMYIDNEFKTVMYGLTIDEKDVYYMEKIDNAIYSANGYIETPFGKTSLEGLSTGCKTLILLNHYKDKIINIQECGANALDIIYNGMDDVSIYTQYELHPANYNPFLMVELVKNGKTKTQKLAQVFEKMST